MSNDTVQLIVKIVVSGVFVGLVSEVAKRLPTLGGLMAALPTITLLTVFWVKVDGATNQQVADLLRGVLIGLIPTSVFIFALMELLKRGVSLPAALIICFPALVVAWLVVRAIA
jgi:hypothetical protein